jgi:hypothetical protein
MKSVNNESNRLIKSNMKTFNITCTDLPKLDIKKSICPKHKSSKSLNRLHMNNLISHINEVVNIAEKNGKQIKKNYGTKPVKQLYNLNSLNLLKEEREKGQLYESMSKISASQVNLPVILINNYAINNYEIIGDRQKETNNHFNSKETISISDKSYASSSDPDSEKDQNIEETKNNKKNTSDYKLFNRNLDSFLKYKLHCAENKIKSHDYNIIEEIKSLKNGVLIPGNLVKSGDKVYTVNPRYIKNNTIKNHDTFIKVSESLNKLKI